LWQLRNFREALENIGFRLGLFGAVCARLHHLPRRRRWALDQLYRTGLGNLHVVLLVGLFIGMIVSLQTGIELARFGQQDQIGYIVAATMAREMGPFITAVILAATTGSAMAAELGTMKVSDELSALDVLSVDAHSFLILPRVIALVVMAPMLAVICDAVGIIGGGLVASAQLGVGWTLYLDSALEALTGKGDVIPLPKDVYSGLFKASVFGAVVAVISCGCGMRAAGGALGVGRATSRAVRDSIVAVIVYNYFLTWLIYQN
ncbi:MAG: ABC transporter permease, partial [Planctomycetota bacterium]|nr:ABC transporter permease [Planctomycetota bacterium]